MAHVAATALLVNQPETLARWSDPATWGGRLPEFGESVVIPGGRRVLLDVSPPPLKSLQINGALIFDETNLNLLADWIVVRGELRIGAASHPHMRRAAIILTAEDPHENVMGLGTKFLAAVGKGTISLHGEQRVKRASLGEVAEPGADHVVVDRWTDWRPGDRIQIRPARGQSGATEELVIIGVDERVLALDHPLSHSHPGAPPTPTGPLLDKRAEVHLLTRNIMLCGSQTADPEFGACVLVMPGSRLVMDGVEGTHLAQRNRAPIFFHPAANQRESSLKDVSLHAGVTAMATPASELVAGLA
jgi:cell migration-inducing and hyaluronan-binding protein